MNLTYDAIDAQGRPTRDFIDARDQRDAVEQLRRRGLYVTQIKEGGEARAKAAAPTTGDPAGTAKLPLKLLVPCTRQLAMLLKSGSGLVPAFKAIKRQTTHPRHAAVFGKVIEDLEDGVTLTEALREHPRSFDAVYCAIVAAGEASGSLTEMFERLSEICWKRRAMHKKIIGALIYPALLIAMCFQILMVMLLFVLPRFGAMFTQLGVETPGTTRVLLQTGEFVRGYWPVCLGVAILSVVAVVILVTNDRGRQWLSNIQTSIPLLGRLQSGLIQGQVFRTMGMLLESRVGVLESLELVRGSTRNRRFQRMFDRIDEAVTSGGRLSTAFEESGVVAPYICQAIHTGEDSGHLGGAITFCADNLDETNEELVKVITRLIEPIILIGMGIVVGGVAISLFMPLFDMTSAIR
jgi:type II secretory pathway component PulF